MRMIKLNPQEKVYIKLKSKTKTRLQVKKTTIIIKLIKVQMLIKDITRKKFIIPDSLLKFKFMFNSPPPFFFSKKLLKTMTKVSQREIFINLLILSYF